MPSSSLRVAELPPSSYADAVGVLARGMRDNPMHVAAYGPDPDRREQAHARLVSALFRYGRKNEPIGVWRYETLVACSPALGVLSWFMRREPVAYTPVGA